jgi:hypothetical protein
MNPLLPADTDNHRFQQKRWLSAIEGWCKVALWTRSTGEICHYTRARRIIVQQMSIEDILRRAGG